MQERDRHHDVHERQPDVHVGVAGAVDRARGGVQQVPAAEQLADADDDEDRRQDAREMGDRAAAELDVELRQLRRGRALGAGEGRGRAGLVVSRVRRRPRLARPAVWVRSMPPITTCMIAARTSDATSAPKTKFCSDCHIGSEKT